jgi:apolipoprotein N-acyltransferase
VSGALLSLAFPCHPEHPLHWLYHPLWAHLALVPLLLVLEGKGFGAGCRAGCLAGFAFNLLGLYWVAHTYGGGPAVVLGTLLMAAYLGLFMGAFAGLLDLLLRRWGKGALAAAPFLWAGQEYLLSQGELGFPWLLLGHGQAAWPHFVQAASWTGAYGISAWVVLVNVLLFLLLEKRGSGRWLLAGGAGLCFLVPWLHGRAVMAASQPWASVLRVGLVQPNLEFAEKWGAQGLERSFAVLEALSRQAAAQGPELMVWPETALPCYLALRPECRGRVQELVDGLQIPLLTGAADYDLEQRRPYNAAFFLRPGIAELVSYAKMHLVPFGERTPFQDAIPLLRGIDWTRLTGALSPAEFAPGTRRTLFSHSRSPFAVLVCFESAFPDLARRHVAEGARLLVNITNDSWFGPTAGPYQHALLSAMRAVENRTSVARCATSGVSVLIDPFGRARQATRLSAAAAVVGDLPLRSASTFYTRHGDLFARCCLVGSLLLAGLSLLPR